MLSSQAQEKSQVKVPRELTETAGRVLLVLTQAEGVLSLFHFYWLTLKSGISKYQNHRIIEVGWDLWRSSVSSPSA